MYNIEQMIAEGQAAIKRNPRRGISCAEFAELTKDEYDRWRQADNCYYFGIALGMRIARAERNRRSTEAGAGRNAF